MSRNFLMTQRQYPSKGTHSCNFSSPQFGCKTHISFLSNFLNSPSSAWFAFFQASQRMNNYDAMRWILSLLRSPNLFLCSTRNLALRLPDLPSTQYPPPYLPLFTLLLFSLCAVQIKQTHFAFNCCFSLFIASALSGCICWFYTIGYFGTAETHAELRIPAWHSCESIRTTQGPPEVWSTNNVVIASSLWVLQSNRRSVQESSGFRESDVLEAAFFVGL